MPLSIWESREDNGENAEVMNVHKNIIEIKENVIISLIR